MRTQEDVAGLFNCLLEQTYRSIEMDVRVEVVDVVKGLIDKPLHHNGFECEANFRRRVPFHQQVELLGREALLHMAELKLNAVERIGRKVGVRAKANAE